MTIESPAHESESSALAAPTEAERRLQRAKQRLSTHVHALDLRARQIARTGTWLAGVVLLGLVGAATAAAMFGRSRRRHRVHETDRDRRAGVGTALMLTALGLISGRARDFARAGRGYYDR